LIFLFNIPLIILGIKNFGAKFLYSTIFAILVNSIFVTIFEEMLNGKYPPIQDALLASLAGGAIDAISLGLIFKQGGTTGGTDIVAKIVRKKIPELELGRLFILVDMFVVILSAIVFGNIENALYSGICVVMTGQILDRVLYGNQSGRLLIIISNQAEEIGTRLLGEMNTGITYLKGTGGYTFQEKNVIICVVKKRLLIRTLQVIKREDDRAFVIVALADKVVGEGYKEEN
jgi:uncharacterized membrane-anchored protein YitT (DUF2179 family)